MEVQLVSPEQVLYTGDAKMVVVRTLGGGDIAFEENHAQFLGALDTWPARVKFDDGTQQWFAVHGGFVEVGDNRVIILSDVAELPAEIDVARAEAAKARAEEALRADAEDEAAQQAAKRAEVRLEVA
ncbi:MAG TPA: ATP synthase F1 subunit epsilon, partial [Acidimicrobiia bacterium]|nr:ATP synthase F1 subunit epsilon [Acidimicrobiia bacterium]